jgi:CxC5 like cysteine cluster associated with KDZ transposases
MQLVRVLDANLTWVDRDLFVAHCPACHLDYYPDHITYCTADNERMQKLEYDAVYIRISIWAHRCIALVQEKALLHFHSGWSNFADWINETIGGGSKMTYQQSQRLFIENFSQRLLVAHEKEAAFACPAHPSACLLAEHVHDIVGCNCKKHYLIWHTLGKGIETSWAILNEENCYSHCLALTPIAKYPDLVHTQGLS